MDADMFGERKAATDRRCQRTRAAGAAREDEASSVPLQSPDPRGLPLHCPEFLQPPSRAAPAVLRCRVRHGQQLVQAPAVSGEAASGVGGATARAGPPPPGGALAHPSGRGGVSLPDAAHLAVPSRETHRPSQPPSECTDPRGRAQPHATVWGPWEPDPAPLTNGHHLLDASELLLNEQGGAVVAPEPLGLQREAESGRLRVSDGPPPTSPTRPRGGQSSAR